MGNLKKANQLGAAELHQQAKVIRLKFDSKTKRLVFDLSNEITFLVPASIIQGLQNATKKDLEAVEFWDDGLMIYWSNLDVAFQVSSLMSGVFGTKNWMIKIASKTDPKVGLAKDENLHQNKKKIVA